MSFPQLPPEPVLDVNCRYYRAFTDLDVPCDESNFHHIERHLPVPVQQAALVLVDVWNTHYSPSWMERAAAVTREYVAPCLEAARAAGVTIVHAPSPHIAHRYPTHFPFQAPIPTPEPPTTHPDWPPPDFRGLMRSGRYAAFGRDSEPRLPGVYAHYKEHLDIADEARPVAGDFVITTGEELHVFLAEKQILHLFYVGFTANRCILNRDFGIMAMNRRGYNIIFIRDASTGLEYHDTLDGFATTEAAIREIEVARGWTTTTDEFVGACQKVSPDKN